MTAPQVPAQDRGSRDMPVPDSSASSCRCYGCRPIRRRHGAGSCRVSSTTVYCMRSTARHTRRFSFFHPHVTQSSNPVHVGLLGRRNAQLIIPADALRAPLNSGLWVIPVPIPRKPCRRQSKECCKPVLSGKCSFRDVLYANHGRNPRN